MKYRTWDPRYRIRFTVPFKPCMSPDASHTSKRSGRMKSNPFEELKFENVGPGQYALEYQSPCDLEFFFDGKDPFKRYELKIRDLNENEIDSTCNNRMRFVPGNTYDFQIDIIPGIFFDPRKSSNHPARPP